MNAPTSWNDGTGTKRLLLRRPTLFSTSPFSLPERGAGEGVAEPVVRREAAEEPRGPRLPADASADLGGVVEDRPPRHAANELEHVAEPLADALGRLAPEDLGEAHVGVREGDGQALAPGGHPADPEVRLAEVDLDLAGQPSQRQEPLGVPAVALAGHLLPAAPGVALHGGVAARVALLVAEPHVDPRGRVAPLAPAPAVVAGPGVDRLLVGREQPALGLVPPRGSGDRSSILAHFLAVGSDTPTALAIAAIGSPPLALLRISSILPTPTIPLWPSPRRKPKQRHCRADCGWSACPCSKPKEFHAQTRNSPTLKPATSRLSNTDGGRVVSWYMVRAETSRAWEALMAPIPAPDVAVCDGGTGFASDVRQAWPRARVQRCL